MTALNDSTELKESDCNWDVEESKHDEFPSVQWTFELTPAEREALLAKAKAVRAAEENEEQQRRAEIEQADRDAAEAEQEKAAPPPTLTASGKPARPAVEQDEDFEDEGSNPDEPAPDPEITDASLKAIEELTEFNFWRTGVGSNVVVDLPGNLGEFEFILDFLLERRPQVELFQGNAKIADSTTLADLNNKENEFMQGVFRQAGLWDDRDKLFKITARTSKRLKDASVRLTDRIRAEWQQGKDLIFHLMHAGIEGDRIKLSIEDPSVKDVFVDPTQRSTGFSAFFGMSMALFARKEASWT